MHLGSDTDESKSFEDQVEKRPLPSPPTTLPSLPTLPSPPTTGKRLTLGKAWWVMFPTFSDHLHHRHHHSHHCHHCHHGHRGVCLLIVAPGPIPAGSTFPHYQTLLCEDLRDWQTLIRDFEIGATRCQTSESDSLLSQEEVPEHRIEHYWTNLLVKKSSVAISKIWKHYRPLIDPNG